MSVQTINVLLGDAIRSEMARQKITNPPALAMRCGVDGQIVRRLLNGTSANPTFENLAALLWGLKKSWDWLGKQIEAGYGEHGPNADRKRAVGLNAPKPESKPEPKASKGQNKPPAKAKPKAKPQAKKPANKAAKKKTGKKQVSSPPVTIPATKDKSAQSLPPAPAPAPAPAQAA